MAKLFLIGLLLLGIISCGSDGSATSTDGPLVRLHVSPVDAGATQAILNVTATGPSGQKQGTMMFTSGPFDLLGVSFPAGTRGPSTYEVKLYKDTCVIATGTATLNIESDGVLDLSCAMMPVPLCGNGATLTLQISKVNMGAGTVTSTPAGINCQSSGAGCMLTTMKGTQVTLTAQEALGSSFAGWNGTVCSGTNPQCTFTLSDNVELQAVFSTCRKWCVEQLPFSVGDALNAVSGSAANDVLIVGDNGAALYFDGTTWSKLSPPSGQVTLRAAAGKAGVSTIYVAGDMGKILTYSGGQFNAITQSIIPGSLRAVALGPGTTPTAYFIGDSTNGLTLGNGSTSVGSQGIGGPGKLYAMSQNPGATGTDLFIGGTTSGTNGFVESWNGGKNGTTAMTGGTSGASIAGEVFAMLGGYTYHYAAGTGGAMIRRSTASGNGMNWQPVSNPAGQTIRAMWAGSDTNIYAVGDLGTLITWDGLTWSKTTLPPPATTVNLRAVWGSSPTNVYAVGDNGTVLHYLP